MITSNAGAEFTTKTTIIVVLPGLQGENTRVRLGKTVVLRRNKPGEFELIRGAEVPNRIGAFAKIRKYGGPSNSRPEAS